MKLDLNYIKEILQIIEDIESDTCSLNDIARKFFTSTKLCNDGDTEFDENSWRILKKHLRDLRSIECLECNQEDFGITEYHDEEIVVNVNTRCSITFMGHQLLESITNDELLNKIKPNLQIITLETLKQMPALAIKALFNLKS